LKIKAETSNRKERIVMLYDPKWQAKTAVVMVLLKAAELVRERGLAKYTQEANDGSICLHGALSIAATGRAYSGNREECGAALAVHKYLLSIDVDENLTRPGGSACWNNQKDRTADDVIAALEGAVAFADC
jgi:hypothetical protein